MKNLSKETLDQILTLREDQGWSCKRIAEKFNVSPGFISWHCLKHGADSPRVSTRILPQTSPGPKTIQRGNHVVRRFTPEEDTELQKLSAENINYHQIGIKMDRNHSSIRGRLMTLARHAARIDASAEQTA